MLMGMTRPAMPAGRYTGALYMTLNGSTTRFQVPVDLSVRTVPFWPLLVLLLGIVLSRLFKYMQDRGGAQAKALAAVYRV